MGHNRVMWVCIWSLFLSLNVVGQTYYFSTHQVPFEPLTNGTALTSGVWDDPAYTVPIGFEFEFFDENITTLTSSDLFLGGTLGVDFSGMTSSVLQVYGPDLTDRGRQTGNSISTILYQTSGPPGQRVFTQEWNDVGFFYGETHQLIYIDYIFFQLKLYEASGNIEFHFGPSSITNPIRDYNGAPGPSVGLVKHLNLMEALVADEVILLSGDPASPEPVYVFEETFLDGSIPENIVYRFSKSPSALSPLQEIEWVTYLHPSPTQGELWLNPNFVPDEIFPVQMYNTLGQLVVQANDASGLQLHSLSPGLYEVRFNARNGIKAQRIIKN